MDLKQALPELLPKAIKWVEEQSEYVQANGLPLNPLGLEIARRVGVQHPEKIRVLTVSSIPVPDDPFLRSVALSQGVVGPDTIGITFGHSLYLVDGQITVRLLSHECRHIYQYERFGSIKAFLTEYLSQIVEFGYQNAPLEIDARNSEIDSA